MINRSTPAFFMTVAMMCPASTAFAQTREAFGPVLPMIYGGGGRHYCLYGYDGPFDPPMESRSDDNIIVCRSGRSPTPRFQDRRFTSPGARARAEALK